MEVTFRDGAKNGRAFQSESKGRKLQPVPEDKRTHLQEHTNTLNIDGEELETKAASPHVIHLLAHYQHL